MHRPTQSYVTWKEAVLDLLCHIQNYWAQGRIVVVMTPCLEDRLQALHLPGAFADDPFAELQFMVQALPQLIDDYNARNFAVIIPENELCVPLLEGNSFPDMVPDHEHRPGLAIYLGDSDHSETLYVEVDQDTYLPVVDAPGEHALPSAYERVTTPALVANLALLN
jgi:hypothetical protein